MSCLFVAAVLLCSMPLTVEWSASPAHDLILAGCHDGVVIFASSGLRFSMLFVTFYIF